MASKTGPKRKSAPARTRGARRPSARPRRETLDDRVRRIVREELEDLRDVLASEAALASGDPIPAEEVWKRLGL